MACVPTSIPGGRPDGHGNRQPKDGNRLPHTNVHLEPVSRRDFDLSYACLLIPRANDHYLTDKVDGFLQATMRQICQFFGWRLDYVQVQPEYLQWVISATAATPPSRSIHTIREQTSKGVLGKFRQLGQDAPPGFLGARVPGAGRMVAPPP